MVAMKQTDFKNAFENLKDSGIYYPEPFNFSIPDARNNLWSGLCHLLGDNAKWLPEYEKVAGWISDNKGKGLLCLGNCGRGKTIISQRIIPALFIHYLHKVVSVYTAQEMNKKADEIMGRYLVMLDDIGTENESVKYGEKRTVFPEIVDNAERKGALLIITTNLRPEELEKKYGYRTLDRLKETTRPVLFNGESMRGKPSDDDIAKPAP